MVTILLYCQSQPPESPAQAPEAVLAPGAAGTSPADDEVAAEEAAATAPSQVALREVSPSQETAAASTAAAAAAAVALISVAPSHESATASTTAVSAAQSSTAAAAQSSTEAAAAATAAATATGAAPENQPGENATMNLDRNEDEIVDLLDDTSENCSLFSSCANNDDDIPLSPAHINFEQFVEREEGHFCTICLTNFSIRDKALGTIQLPIQNDESSRL